MKKLITEQYILDLIKSGKLEIEIDENTIFTPLAKDRINDSKIRIVKTKIVEKIEISNQVEIKKNIIAIGSDHTGFEVKEILKKFLTDKKYNLIDVGTNSKNSCDYPDFAIAVAKNVAMKNVDFGIIVDATGIPSAITANKIPGIRAATCYNEFTAHSAREHNNANVLVVGAKALGEETIKSIINEWIKTDFAGGRHQKRLDKIKELEKIFLKF